MEMAELKKLTKDKRQAVHQQLSQCQLGRDSECVRKTPHGVETRSHSRETFWSPCLRRGFLFAYESAPTCRWRWAGPRSWLAPVGKPGWEKPCTSKANYDYQCCQLHSRQDSCCLPCEQRFRQGDHCECSAKEHHVPLTSGARKAEWLPC